MQLTCVKCGQVMETPELQAGGAFQCPGCGTVMEAPPAPPAVSAVPAALAAAPAPAAAGKPCPYCGETILPEAVKCRHCGEFLDPAKREEIRAARELVPKFQKGMKSTGVGLIVLAALNFLAGMVMMGGRQEVPGLGLWVLGAAAVILVLGVLMLARQVWANYAAAGFFGLIIALNIFNLANGEAGVNLIALLIPIVVMLFAVGNLKQRAKIVRAGLDPWDASGRSGPGGPKARAKR